MTYSVNELFSFTFLVNQEFLFSKKKDFKICVSSFRIISFPSLLEKMARLKLKLLNKFPKISDLRLDGISKYKNVKKMSGVRLQSQQEYKSWKKSWEFRDQFQQNDRSTWAQCSKKIYSFLSWIFLVKEITYFFKKERFCLGIVEHEFWLTLIFIIYNSQKSRAV